MVAGAILTNASGGAGLTFPQIVTFTINVPEPGQVQMLASGAGLIGLVALMHRRRRT